MDNSIGQKIKQLRVNHLLTQNELAEILHVSSKTISKWENDVGVPDIAHIVPIARALGITADELLTNSDESESTSASKSFDLIQDKYKIRFDTICEAVGVDRETVITTITTGEFSKSFADKAKTHKLGVILVHLNNLIEMFTNNRHLLINNLFSKLAHDNYISASTVAAYTCIPADVFEAYILDGTNLSAEQECSLLAVLFLLDSVLNREDAFPWS